MDLSFAIKNNNYSRLEKLLKNGADANAKDENGVSLLHQAVNYGCEKIVKLLLKNDANVLNVTHDKGNTALHIAVVKSNITISAILLENISRDKLRKLLDVKTKKTGSTALHVAVKSHNYEIAKLLLINGAMFNSTDKEGKKPMDFVKNKLIESLLKSIEMNFSLVNFDAVEIYMNIEEQPLDEYLCMTNCRDSEGRTLSQVILKEDRKDIFKILLATRSNRSSEFPQSDIAALNELASSFESFISNSSNILTKLKGKTSTAFREVNYMLNEVRKLLKAFHAYEQKICTSIRTLNVRTIEEALEFLECQLNYEKLLLMPHGIGTLIHVNLVAIIPSVFTIKRKIFTAKLLAASKINDLVEVERCLENRLDINERDEYSAKSPLHLAAFYGYVDLTQMLLDWHASLSCLDVSGNMPLHIAASNGHVKIVEMLLARNLEMIDVKGMYSEYTALHLATGAGCFDVVKCLLKHGARYRIENRTGNMPIDMARDTQIFRFFVTMDVLFAMATQGNEKIVRVLNKLKNDELIAMANARDEAGYTLTQTAIVSGYKSIADGIKRVVKLAAERHGGKN